MAEDFLNVEHPCQWFVSYYKKIGYELLSFRMIGFCENCSERFYFCEVLDCAENESYFVLWYYDLDFEDFDKPFPMFSCPSSEHLEKHLLDNVFDKIIKFMAHQSERRSRYVSEK